MTCDACGQPDDIALRKHIVLRVIINLQLVPLLMGSKIFRFSKSFFLFCFNHFCVHCICVHCISLSGIMLMLLFMAKIL
ncbi:hypothetical protein GLOIN_2v1686921 [Rhizophagus irregularis DAOM 181602=DAOM 197198]|uniref:Uncharacterized protein n=1 Tax=Rhizophagus irregularis (strain DAOM 181602 / DAOM 197198 / MUCL 43194) TaxID=747089 RepID=A0A2P4PDG1_RHIID|nr:hypothetical protein GLOIN_2v1686921 [Rhizophagus irregularis DAOM 181602=DAOM 197198]POG63407.1 hypothetical protein GLOIN_2v1686921 [Rhizophagus irregularis DAOM 181602=DAOM 197198]|eukprot:XP_025170273.1 hypothetical protein GLOIN_2v1686921 [Rhizophagus irregularis DAOM 181602=DAOM 197198]